MGVGISAPGPIDGFPNIWTHLRSSWNTQFRRRHSEIFTRILIYVINIFRVFFFEPNCSNCLEWKWGKRTLYQVIRRTPCTDLDTHRVSDFSAGPLGGSSGSAMNCPLLINDQYGGIDEWLTRIGRISSSTSFNVGNITIAVEWTNIRFGNGISNI